MPWASLKQERWGNSLSGHKAMGDAKVEEFNAASKGMKLPKRVAAAPKTKMGSTFGKRKESA